MPGGWRLSRSHGGRLDASEMRGVMGEAAGCPELAVADAIDPDLDLLLHRFRDGWCHLRGDERGVRYLGAGEPPRHVLPAFWRRQPADMRGSDPRHAPFHLPVLPGACVRSAHDNTTIVIEPDAAPIQGKLPLAEFASQVPHTTRINGTCCRLEQPGVRLLR